MFTIGTKVQGFYHNLPYNGVIVESRVDAATYKYLLTIDLDVELVLYGTKRNRIHFSDNDCVTVEAI